MIEIFKDTKQTHLKNIAKTVGCDLEEILFFDNERGNCMDVAAIGTSVAFVPEGVTAKSLGKRVGALSGAGRDL